MGPHRADASPGPCGATGRGAGTVERVVVDDENVDQLRDEYGSSLGEHQRLLREAFAAHRGEEVDSRGEAFFSVFSRARDAAAAAVDGQRALTSYAWPDGAEFRVRVGMHTGEPVLSDEAATTGWACIALRGSWLRATAARCSLRRRPPHCSPTMSWPLRQSLPAPKVEHGGTLTSLLHRCILARQRVGGTA
jgi:hypothetical protein